MNEGFRSLFGVTFPALFVGLYNILKDDVLRHGLRPDEQLAPVFEGKTILSTVVQYPLELVDLGLGLEKKDLLVLEMVAFPVWSEHPAGSGVIVVFKDVVERQKMQVRLAESEKRYRTLMEALPDMLFCVAPDKTVLFVNENSAVKLHTTPEQVAGKNFSDLFPPQNFERMWRKIERVFDTGRPAYSENKTIFGKTPLWLDTWLVPLHDNRGAVYAVMGVSRDITEKKKYKEELEKTRNLESLGTLAGGIAHDFNNILAAVQGNLSLIKATCAGHTEQTEYVSQAFQATERARAITQQLLTFSKGGAPIRQEASIRELMVDSTEFIVHGTAVRAEFSIPDDLWPCRLDSGQISQVIQNLVSNAVQAMPKGGIMEVSACNVKLEKGHASGFAGRFMQISVRTTAPEFPRRTWKRSLIPFSPRSTRDTASGFPSAILS
ncbi:MAG: PAS domain-containing protein [Spirochaetales bacterium]|nr:PAS domain-containing protein [Spirochaetales bacterium]